VHRVAVLFLPPVVGFDAAIAPMLLGAAEDEHGNPLYEVITCGLTDDRVQATNGFDVVPAAGAEVLATADTVVIPGTRYPPARHGGVLAPDVRAALDSIRPGTRLVSICTGAFVLAAAGLLDGRRVTTHWKYADALRRLHPKVWVDEKVLFVDDGDVLTSAGLAAGIDLCLHIIRSDHGAQVANEVLRRAAVAGGWAGPVHRPAATDGGRRLDGRHPRVGIESPRRGPGGRAIGQAREHESADVQSPLPRGDGAGTGHLGA
jgi:transcriptional regulator GlxA family with amidase domain